MKAACLRLTILCLSLIVVSEVSAGGGKETGAYAGEFRDADSDDVVLQRGLPAVKGSGPATVMTGWTAGAAWDAMQSLRDNIVPKYYPELRLELEAMSTGKMKTVAASRLASGSPSTAATVPAGVFITEWARDGALLELTPLWQRYDLEEIIPEPVARLCRLNDTYYAVPVTLEQHGFMWWNNDVLDRAGVTRPPYHSWDEFFAAADEFNRRMDVPFMVSGLTPQADAMDNVLYFAAKRFGPEIYERVYDGTATAADWERALTFYARILELSNDDHRSLFDVSDNQNRVANGEGAVTFQGFWAWNVFDTQKIAIGTDYGRGHFPGPPIYKFSVGSFVAFQGSGKESIGRALAAVMALRESQLTMSRKGTIPARRDVSLNADRLPGVSLASSAYLTNANPVLVPTAAPNTVLPEGAYTSYPQPVVRYLTGRSSLEEAVDDLLRLQTEYGNELQHSTWDF